MQLALEESANDDDQIIDADGIKLLIGERDRPYFEGRKLDYTKSMFGFGQFLLLNV